jgi:nucleoid-associated protein YgaU
MGLSLLRSIARSVLMFLFVLIFLGTMSCTQKIDGDSDFDLSDEEAEEITEQADTDVVPESNPEEINSGGNETELAPLEEGLQNQTSQLLDTPPDQEFIVKKGDTLMTIAYETCGTVKVWRKILADNADKITNPNVLRLGIKLKISGSLVLKVSEEELPGMEKELIQEGDTLGSISKRLYGVKKYWKKLAEFNRQLISDPNKIYAGFTIEYLKDPQQLVGLDRSITRNCIWFDLCSFDTTVRVRGIDSAGDFPFE